MLFGPLAAASEVIKSRNTASMPFLPLLFTLMDGAVWFSYGFYICNVELMAPNGLGVLFGIFELALYVWAMCAQEADENRRAAALSSGAQTVIEHGKIVQII